MKLETKEADIFDKYVLREPKPEEWTSLRLSKEKNIDRRKARRMLRKMVQSGEAELVTRNGIDENYKCNIWRILDETEDTRELPE